MGNYNGREEIIKRLVDQCGLPASDAERAVREMSSIALIEIKQGDDGIFQQLYGVCSEKGPIATVNFLRSYGAVLRSVPPLEPWQRESPNIREFYLGDEPEPPFGSIRNNNGHS